MKDGRTHLAAELEAVVRDRPVLLYEHFTGPAVTNSVSKKFFDAADSAPPVYPDIKKINVSASGSIAAAGFTGGGPSASALIAAFARLFQLITAHCAVHSYRSVSHSYGAK
jgi:hypothetical protein